MWIMRKSSYPWQRLLHQGRPCEAYKSSSSPWHECFINIVHEKCITMVQPSRRCRPCGLTVHPCNHGLTVSSTSAVWIRITTMDRQLHQRRPCGSISQPWLDCLIKVDHAGLTSFFTTMARPPQQSRPCGSYNVIHNHGSTVSSKLVMWVLQESPQP
jgi:hypothetical protein